MPIVEIMRLNALEELKRELKEQNNDQDLLINQEDTQKEVKNEEEY